MQQIDIDQAAAAIEAGATVIDVREPAEFAEGHAPGARNIPVGELPGRAHELDRSSPVHLICASGNRSGAMAEHLTQAGFTAVNISGGTAAWIDSGRPVEK